MALKMPIVLARTAFVNMIGSEVQEKCKPVMDIANFRGTLLRTGPITRLPHL